MAAVRLFPTYGRELAIVAERISGISRLHVTDEGTPTRLGEFAFDAAVGPTSAAEQSNALKAPKCADNLNMIIDKLDIVERLRPFYDLSSSNRHQFGIQIHQRHRLLANHDCRR